MARLTNRQRIFIEEYLTCWNASEAARRAGFTGDANTVGPRLLANVGIKAAVEARIQEKAMTADEVLIRLAEMARANPNDFIEQEPKAFYAHIGEGEEIEPRFIESAGIKWDEMKRRGHLVKKLSFNQYGPVMEFYDAQNALQLIGKHLQLFVDRTEITGKDGGPIEVSPILDKALKKIYGDHSDSGA
jgi:phage terminase small subunit